MKTLGARLAVGYALLSTLTLFSLLAAGYHLLNRHVSGGLDLLNRAEAERVKATLLVLPAPPSPEDLVAQLRVFAPAKSASFLFELCDLDERLLFRSSNLGDHSLRTEDGGNGDLRVPGLGPLRVGTFSLPGGTLRIATFATEAREMMNTYAGMSFLLVCLILLASLVTGMLLSQAALRPVRAIQETANHIRSDNLSMRIPVPDSSDEISSLAQLLNEMFDRLESSFDQIRRFTAETSHELKTPLSLIRLHTEKLLMDDGLTPSQQETLQMLLEEAQNLGRIIENLLFLSRAEAQAITAEVRRQDPRGFLEDFAEDARTLTEHSGLHFDMIVSGRGEVDLDTRLLRQVLLNLIGNAVAVSPPGGLITVESDFTLNTWCLAVEDDGPGVPEADRERIFERFVRLQSKPEATANGSGLGLTICRSLLTLHRGTIRAEAGVRRGGLRVICEIPLPKGAPLSRARRPEKELAAAGADAGLS